MIDDINQAIRRLVRSVMAMPENSVRPAKQHAPAGGQTDEIATVDIVSDEPIGTPAISLDTVGTYPSDVTTERVDQVHRFVASVNFYRRPPDKAYLRGAAVSADHTDYLAIEDGAFDISIDGTNRQVDGLDFSAVTSMLDVAAVIQARLAAALASTRCAWDATYHRFVVTSPTSNQASNVGGAAAPTTAVDPNTDVSAVLGLTVAGGALPVNNRAGLARYSNAAVDRAARLPQRLWTASARALMHQFGLAFQGASSARNLTALEDGAWESRGQVDLTFAVVAREAETIQTIATVPLNVNSQAPGGAVHTENFEVTQ